MYEPNTVMNFLDGYELGASKAKPKKKKRKLGAKIKKGLKKVGKVVGAVATGGLSLAVKPAIKGLKKSKVGKKIKKAVKGAADVVAHVQAKSAGDCQNTDELVRLVAAKLVATLGPPLDAANQTLARFDLQRQATYEHRKLMSDDSFRRRVLAYLGAKAKRGNCSCKRTISLLGR